MFTLTIIYPDRAEREEYATQAEAMRRYRVMKRDGTIDALYLYRDGDIIRSYQYGDDDAAFDGFQAAQLDTSVNREYLGYNAAPGVVVPDRE